MIRWLIPLAAAVVAVGPVHAADPPKQYDVPYRLTDTKHVLVRAKLNGKGPYNFILDTGAPAVFIPKKLAKELKLELDNKGWGEFSSFEVEGGVKVPKTKTRVEDLFQLEGMNGMGLAGVELHGVIGYNVLAQFRITYDFAAAKLTWVPLDFEPPAPKGLSRGNGQGGLEILGPIMKILAGFMGITPNFETRPRGFLGIETDEKDGGVFVKAVLADGPAATAGLKPGDKIESVGIATGRKGRKRTTDIDTPKDLAKVLSSVKPNDELTIQVRRGDKSETVTITLGRGL